MRVRSILLGDSEIDKTVYNIFDKKDGEDIVLKDRGLFKKDYTERVVIDDIVLSLKHDPKQFDEFYDYIQKQTMDRFSTDDFVNYSKYHYHPIEITIEKNKEKADSIEKRMNELYIGA